jgi:hypothetical protein
MLPHGEQRLLHYLKGGVMLKLAVILLLVGFGAALFGFTMIAGMVLFMFLNMLALALFATRAV